VDWGTIFHGSRRRINTLIIGGEQDSRSRKGISKEERARLLRRLREYVNLSYDSEATIAARMGVGKGVLSAWLRGEIKPTLPSFLEIRDFLDRQVEMEDGIAPVGYVPRPSGNPNGRRRSEA
jgi:transcriptional regulator with XRE-family HTH domain